MMIRKILKSSIVILVLLVLLIIIYHYLPIRYKLPIRKSGKTLVAKLEYVTYSYDDGQNDQFKYFRGGQFLVIGDSQTAMYKWQTYLGCLIHADIDTHARGAIGMVEMVDGNLKTEKSLNIDPNSFGVDYILPLNVDEVKNKDYIIIMGLYNENNSFENQYGYRTDLYPQKNTYCGRFNYMIKRIRQELSKSRNTSCKIILAGPHLFGRYPYNEKDAYHYSGLSDSLHLLCKDNKIAFCNLRELSGIDSTNWALYQNHNYVKNDPLANPNILDDLHLNKRGQMKVAVAIAKWLGENF